jgi:hypothetical protein
MICKAGAGAVNRNLTQTSAKTANFLCFSPVSVAALSLHHQIELHLLRNLFFSSGTEFIIYLNALVRAHTGGNIAAFESALPVRSYELLSLIDIVFIQNFTKHAFSR